MVEFLSSDQFKKDLTKVDALLKRSKAFLYYTETDFEQDIRTLETLSLQAN